MRVSIGLIAILVAFLTGSRAISASAPPARVIARIDLSKPFHLAPGANFTATQGPDIVDPYYVDADKEAGRIHLCVRAKPSADCVPLIDDVLDTASDKDPTAGIHYLEISEIVHPRGASGPPLLHLQVASVHATNGSQGHAAIVLAYRPSRQRFERIFEQIVGGNMNQEIRYIASGPLKGAMIGAEPTDNAPFGYWITVSRLTDDYRYRHVLRYRSATRYGDGNPLAVIDSEMPNILHRLGLWRPGQPLPLPASPCPRPHLVKTALWCTGEQ